MVTDEIYQQAAAVKILNRRFLLISCVESVWVSYIQLKTISKLNITVKKPRDLSDARGNVAESLIIPVLTI